MEQKRITNPMKVIRAKCLDFCCGSGSEVENCTVLGCPLYPFRMGTNPYRSKRVLTPAQREAQIAALAKARQSKGQNNAKNKAV